MLKQTIKKKLLQKLVPSGYYYSFEGYCPCCESQVTFLSYNPVLRERLKCTSCNSSTRERALMMVIDKHFPGWKHQSIHESSPEMRGVSQKLKNDCRGYVATQFYPGEETGVIIDGFRNEDLEQQTFADNTFDIVVTQDVMEHVYNPQKAFSEIARTLKKGGAHIFTIPVINRHMPTEVWATLGKDGKPNFLKTPEFHGNPVSSEGSAVTMHWGYDIVDHIRDYCGMDTVIENLHVPQNGVFAEFEVFVSFKK
jgi:SAM-dependent methyltransferase